MLRLLSLFILLLSFVYANDTVEIFATSMDSKDNIVNAYGDVVVVYKNYHLSAKSALYDRDSGDLELYDNIRATQGNELQLLGNYAKLNIKNKEKTFKPFFMLEKKSEVWLSADEGFMRDEKLDINSGSVSGCNPNDPLWTMEFSSSDYNSDTKWLNLYNTVVYIYDIPVMYTPYVGFSLDKTRRTGLLTPALGVSDKEGFYFEQPIYIAEQNWWDLELKPQMRTNRGYGAYSTFRFKDSAISGGELTGGYFKENDSYFIEHELANKSHSGFNFKYENGDVLNQWLNQNFEGQSGLFVNINSMNDVDYINLSTNDPIKNATATQVLSRANMFYNTDENYFGTYLKYYQDLTKQSNDNTLQKLPTLQYHNYLNSLLQGHLFYSLDMQSSNIYRDINKKVVQTNLNVPVTLQTSALDEQLNLSYKTTLYSQHSTFSGVEEVPTDTQYQNGYIAKNYNQLSASTELAKAYEEYTHVVSFGSNYSFAGGERREGFYDYNKEFCSDLINQSDPRCEFYTVSQMEDVLKFDFSQYVYDSLGKQILYHKLSQAFFYEVYGTKTGELENELDYLIVDGLSYYNDSFFNYKEQSFSKLTNQLSYGVGDMTLSMAHLYKDTFLDANTGYTPYASYLTSSAKYSYNTHYSYHVDYAYDLERSKKKKSEVGMIYKKRCWDFGLRYVENNRPVLSKIGVADNSVFDRYIFFTVALTPIMSSGRGSSEFGMTLPKSF
ncbi:MAG: LPS assembly protein LptD [Sulfurimonas sp.]